MDSKRKMMVAAAVMIFITSTIYFTRHDVTHASGNEPFNETKFGEMCINTVVPSVKKIDENRISYKVETAEEEIKKSGTETAKTTIKPTGKPLVIIYHTHSSESYMPYKESNYHRVEEEGTVRDVGNVMEQELERRGINCIHDKTIHDRPSYNESYARSLETIQKLRGKYPTAVYIIDLHRDAAAPNASEGNYIKINSKRVASFSLVVGRANENYVELYDFAKKVSETANSRYAGFSRGIIERDYNYNEFVSNNALLLEVGNNKNTIEEARACGKYFADILASIIEEKK